MRFARMRRRPGRARSVARTSALSRSSSIASANASRPPAPRGAQRRVRAQPVQQLHQTRVREQDQRQEHVVAGALSTTSPRLCATAKTRTVRPTLQKSSCTLDAGVKIYASRVDSFHNETFKMLGGMNKVATVEEGEEEEGGGFETAKGDGEGSDGEGAPLTRKKRRRAASRFGSPGRAHRREGGRGERGGPAVPKDQRAVRRGRRLGLAAQQPLRAPRVQHSFRLGGGAGVPRRFSDE